jgi:hypothetical protein
LLLTRIGPLQSEARKQNASSLVIKGVISKETGMRHAQHLANVCTDNCATDLDGTGRWYSVKKLGEPSGSFFGVDSSALLVAGTKNVAQDARDEALQY